MNRLNFLRTIFIVSTVLCLAVLMLSTMQSISMRTGPVVAYAPSSSCIESNQSEFTRSVEVITSSVAFSIELAACSSLVSPLTLTLASPLSYTSNITPSGIVVTPTVAILSPGDITETIYISVAANTIYTPSFDLKYTIDSATQFNSEQNCTPSEYQWGTATIPITNTITTTLIITENGNSSVFPLSLCRQPQGLVTLTLTSPITNSGLTIKPSQLFFDDSNWNIEQAISITLSTNNLSSNTDVLTMVYSIGSTDPDYNGHITITATITRLATIAESTALYLPLVTKSEPVAKWEQIGLLTKSIDALEIYDNRIYAAGRDADTGVFFLECGPESSTSLGPIVKIRDIAIKSENLALIGTQGSGVYYATDLADGNWQPVPTTDMNPYVYGVAFGANGSAYAGTDIGVYKSPNAISNWTLVPSTPTLINSLHFQSQANSIWIGTVGIDASTSGDGIYKLSSDGVLQSFNDGLDGAAAKEIWDIDSADSSEIYIATSDGVYRSDGTNNWTRIGLANQQVISIELSGDKLYAGLNVGGVQSAELNEPISWMQESGITLSLVRDLVDISANDSCQGELLAATDDGVWILK